MLTFSFNFLKGAFVKNYALVLKKKELCLIFPKNQYMTCQVEFQISSPRFLTTNNLFLIKKYERHHQ